MLRRSLACLSLLTLSSCSAATAPLPKAAPAPHPLSLGRGSDDVAHAAPAIPEARILGPAVELPAPLPAAPAPEPAPRRSAPLPSGLHNPMPAGVMAGYRADTGLDIAGHRLPVFALAAGTLDYSEPGHTLWTGPGDTANTVRLALDEPIAVGDRRVTHLWYAHLSALVYQQAEGAPRPIHVEAGEELGISGVANGSPHLHLGMLLDGDVSQRWGSFLLEDAVRQILGGYRPGQRLPAY